jgi:hypothetical protein
MYWGMFRYSSTSVPQLFYGLICLTCHCRSPPMADRATSATGQPHDLRRRRTVFLFLPDSPATWPDKSSDNLSNMSCSHAYYFLASQTNTWHTIGLSDGSMLRRAAAYTPPQTLSAPRRPCRCSCQPDPPPSGVAGHNRLRHGAPATTATATSPPTMSLCDEPMSRRAYAYPDECTYAYKYVCYVFV